MQKRIYCDLDGVCANLNQLQQQRLQDNPNMLFPQAEYGFFLELEEIPNAIVAIKLLAKYFDIWFLTSPSYKNPMCLAEKNYWIRNHFGLDWTKKLIISNDKSLLKGDYLIDDNIIGRNQDKFEGKLLHFGSSLYSDWNAIMQYFITFYNLQHQIKYKQYVDLITHCGLNFSEIEQLSNEQIYNLTTLISKHII